MIRLFIAILVIGFAIGASLVPTVTSENVVPVSHVGFAQSDTLP